MILCTTGIPKEHQQLCNKVRWPISLFTPNGKIGGVTENINPSGLFVFPQAQLPTKGSVHVVIKLPNGQKLKASTKVVWKAIAKADNGSPQLGTELKFIRIFENDREFLKSVMTMHYMDKARRIARDKMSPPKSAATKGRK
jgi:hypothetical protein